MARLSPSGATLADRALVRIGGEDAAPFLQNLLTCDVESLMPGTASHGALLSPQGKVMFEFIVLREQDSFVLDMASQLVGDFIKRIGFYRLRAKVNVEPAAADMKVFALWGGDASGISGAFPDPRLPALGMRLHSATAPAFTAADYMAHRLACGIPEMGTDYAPGEVFAHEALLDQTGGVSLSKGCYVGQEIVSRMHHRGTARSRFVIVRSDGPLPPAGSAVTAAGRTLGTMGGSAGRLGLAMLRLDKTAEAMAGLTPIFAGGVGVEATIPPFATFSFEALRTA
jgi:hypothetical protein